MLKCQKFALDIPIFKSTGLSKQDLKAREDQLTAYFLHELKKPARAAE